jgi:hypothetical protein
MVTYKFKYNGKDREIPDVISIDIKQVNDNRFGTYNQITFNRLLIILDDLKKDTVKYDLSEIENVQIQIEA